MDRAVGFLHASCCMAGQCVQIPHIDEHEKPQMPKYKKLTAGTIVNMVRDKAIAFIAPDGKNHTVFMSAKNFAEYDVAQIGDRVAYIPMIPENPIKQSEVAIRCRLTTAPLGEQPEPMPMNGLFIGNETRLINNTVVGRVPFDSEPYASREEAEEFSKQRAEQIGANIILNSYFTVTERGGLSLVIMSGHFGLLLDGPLPCPSQWDNYKLST